MRLVEPFSSKIPSESYYTHSTLQPKINPYELISSTLHNNEFSPSLSLCNLMRKTEIAAESTIRQKCNNNILCLFSDQKFNVSTQKSNTHTISGQPPPLPALESLPLSVKSVSNKILDTAQIGKTLSNSVENYLEFKAIKTLYAFF